MSALFFLAGRRIRHPEFIGTGCLKRVGRANGRFVEVR
jgi:hypothetical protein